MSRSCATQARCHYLESIEARFYARMEESDKLRRIPFRNDSDRTIYILPSIDGLVTAEEPFAGATELEAGRVAWFWIECSFKSAVAFVGLQGELMLQTDR